MKVLLFTGARKLFSISGLGRAILHQKAALTHIGIDFTENLNDNYDIVHINTYTPQSKRLAKKARRSGKAVVYHAHSTKEDFERSFIGSTLLSPLFKRWIVSCYRLGDVILTPTEYSKRLLESYGLSNPIFPISNGVELAFYTDKKSDRKEFREKYGYSENDKVVMSVGLYFERKGLLDFVELAREMPDFKFIWFGKTPLWTVPRKIRKAVKTKLPNLIFAGYVPPEELKKAYVGADLFEFMTYEETEGIVLLEALAAGQNVLIRDIPAFDWLEDKQNVYKARSLEQFKQLTESIINEKAESLAAKGREAVSEKSIEKTGEKLLEAYKTALDLSEKRQHNSR